MKSDVIDIKDRLNDFLTSSDLNDYVKTEDLEGYLTPEDIQDLASKSDLEGYVKVEDAVDFLTASDLDGYLKVSELPVNVSDFINDAGYITENDLPDYLLDSDLDNLKDDINEIKENVTELSSGLAETQTSVTSLTSDLTEISGQVSQNTEDIEELSTNLDNLTDMVGTPEDGSEPATGIFEELDELNRKVKGASLGTYTLPVMTPEMVEAADADPDVEFDGSEDPYILVENDMQPTQAQGDAYLGLIQDMTRAIRALQAEVARLKNSFDYGIDSYTNTRTAKSAQLGLMDEIQDEEPLWALDPQVGMSLVPDSPIFNTLLDLNHKFLPVGGSAEEVIDVSVDGQLTFVNGGGKFCDGNEENPSDDNLTLYKLTDSKLITYLVTDKPDIKMTLVSLKDKNITREINFAPLLQGNIVNKYGFCVVISRKQVVDEVEKGFNYIYFSIINYENDQKLCEGYLTNDGVLTDTRFDIDERYAIKSIEFDRLTLSRMKFYTKYEDFTDEVIPSAPSEDDYKLEVAHIAIRSVRSTEILNTVANQLRDNELIWNKETNTLHIKSDGKIYAIGSKSDDEHNKDNDMTDREIIEALEKMGIVINVEYELDEHGDETDVIKSVSNMSLSPISDVTFINEDTNRKFTFSVDPEGNLVAKDKSAQTITEFLGSSAQSYENPSTTYQAVRGFSSDYLLRKNGSTDILKDLNKTSDAGKMSDRLRISAFYAPISTDEAHGCTHSFIELENTSPMDIPLTGIYLHFFNPAENTYENKDGVITLKTNIVHHLELDGVIKAGGTYLIRGAKHAEFDDESAFIKVKTFDKEWYEDGQLISFEQRPGKENVVVEGNATVPAAYRFCLTYGFANLSADKKLVEANSSSITIGTTEYKKSDYPNIIVDPRFIDSCSYSTVANISKQNGTNNPWYANGGGVGITITANSMFRLMFALDPAKQAYNGFNGKDSSRTRYNKGTDIQILKLDKEFIGYPHSNEIIKISRFTPKASFENKNVMTDKSQLDREKPNMVTCSFGVDVYNTRCFNWISCGAFDEYVWLRRQGDTSWIKFQSYKKVSEAVTEGSAAIHRKEYSVDVNNTVYARMINRFPGNDVLFTAHKCVVILPDASSEPEKYEYVVGRPDKDGKPDTEHTNPIYTFTVYPRTYEGRMYQITDQQGFHWIEYQVWSASAEYLNTKIDEECAAINADPDKVKVFPILMNTGDMTQSGARVNEWLDYYNGGVSLFNHLEQMNCVGNNDLCPINPREMGTGNDNDKSSSHFFHYFYCFDVKDTEKCESVASDKQKFFSGESLVVKAHTGRAQNGDVYDTINVKEDKYIPSFYYYKTNKVLYVVVNSEIPFSNCQKWFGLCSETETPQYLNIYTGIEAITNGKYAGDVNYFTPLYETLYTWLDDNKNDSNSRKVIVAMHEMPFTVITKVSLANNDNVQIPCTRNHPTNAGRLGSNVNQLNIKENRGIYWCSRLLEFFNCKLVIGGHKHTYALSYPIKEKYSWTYTGETAVEGIETNHTYDSSEKMKPMLPTMEGEAGTNPIYNVSWDIDLTSDAVRNEYKITTVRTGDKSVANDTKLNSTKTPYIPDTLYEEYGSHTYESATGLFRCCTPLTGSYSDKKYDNFVVYSMCQATGYKLKSNKELPSEYQMFSKIIPKTTHGSSDSPNENQLYPMYSVLEFNNDCSELEVSMNRITGIFNSNGTDKFDQSSYGKGPMGVQMLCTGDDVAQAARMYGTWVDKATMDARDIDERYLHIKF